jgi:hypothetical protein
MGPRATQRALVLRGAGGSILLLVLFVCLATAVVIQTLVTVALCIERESSDEIAGRQRLASIDRGLVLLKCRALSLWQPGEWTLAESKTGPAQGTIGTIVAPEDSTWVMQAEVRENPGLSGIHASARLERGRDGIDLPLAALAAARVDVDASRGTSWLGTDPAPTDSRASAAIAYLCTPPNAALLDDGCTVVPLSSVWHLDPGWLQMATDWEDDSAAGLSGPADPSAGLEASEEAASLSVVPLSGVVFLNGRRGERLRLADFLQGLGDDQTIAGMSVDSPVLVVVIGGAELDARDLGELYGVAVVDDGSICLEGTTLHGAVFATETVDLGVTGRLLFSRPVLRWATDRSLRRVRLVPGSRWEDTE